MTIISEVTPATLAACVGFLCASAERTLDKRLYREKALNALYSGRPIDLAFVRVLEEEIAAAYRWRRLRNPPTLAAFVKGPVRQRWVVFPSTNWRGAENALASHTEPQTATFSKGNRR